MGTILPFGPKVTREHWCEPQEGLPYGGAFLFCQGGRSRIRLVQDAGDKEDLTLWLTVNDVPILSWIAPGGCPTCEQLLRSGSNDFDTARALGDIYSVDTERIAADSWWFEAYYPLLGICEPGLYFLSVCEYYPTDGEGKLFWGSHEESREATSINYDFVMDPGSRPCFLVGTQGRANYSHERHQRAAETFGSHPGIAFHLDGYLSALLDGHHRALAAAEAGEPFLCVTIARTAWYWQDQDMSQRPTAVTGFYDTRMPGELLSASAAKWIRDASTARVSSISTPSSSFPHKELNQETRQAFNRAARKISSFPTVQEVSAGKRFGSLTDEDVEEAFTSDHAYPDPGTILDAFIGGKNPRARSVAIRIVRDDGRTALWPDALRYLAGFDDREVLDLFWELALRDDIRHQVVLKLVNEYLEKHGDRYE